MIDVGFLETIRTLAIVCTQWGDTGKGKFVDLLAQLWADIIVRGTGGANAGHTIRRGEKEIVVHLLPSGMLTDKLNIIGTGVAVEPGVVMQELNDLTNAGYPAHNLLLSLGARLVLPQHIVLDRVRESRSGGIGTTGRGMGPVYTDHVARLGLIVNDLLNPDVFIRKLDRNLEEKTRVLLSYDPEVVKQVLHQPILSNGLFYHPTKVFDRDAIVDRYLAYGRELRQFVADTDTLVQKAVGKKRILLEGAQGNLLSVDYGTYPYVTSSDCSIGGLAKGVGLHEGHVDLTLGVTKAPYMTRVGEGPFPTELGGERSADHCRVATRASEKAMTDVSLNHGDEFMQGVAIRQAGDEYGATTGRPRRTGWLDLPLIRYSARHLTGPNVILTKLDVMDEAETIRICDAYRYTGPDYVRGPHTFRSGHTIKWAIPDVEIMRHCQPLYTDLPGWQQSIRTLRQNGEIPPALARVVNYLEIQTGVNVVMLSVGPGDDETIVMKSPRR